MTETKRIVLLDELELELPDGSVVCVKPGPYRKGIAVIPVYAKETVSRGRRPRDATLALREKLEKDAASNHVRSAAAYVKWYLTRDTDVDPLTARQIVYRERKRVLPILA